MPAKVIRFATFEFDLERRELRQARTRVPLQHKPFRILEILLREPGALVTRRELAKELWPDLHVNFEHSLNSAVNSLRLALGDSPRLNRFIETRSGLGYRFIAPIEQSGSAKASVLSSSSYQDYLKGRFFLNKMTTSALHRAIGCFQAALKEDSNSSLPLSGLADAYSQLSLTGSVRSADVCHAAREFVATALRAQPDLAEPHVSLGRLRMILDWDWMGAAEAFSQAISLDPELTDAYRGRALMFSSLNRHQDALRDMHHAHEIDPLSSSIGYELAWLLYLSGQFAEAVSQSWAVLSLDPGFFPAQHVLGLAYGQLGSHEEAVTECENACACSDRHPGALASLGYAYAAAGLTHDAKRILDELMALAQRQHVSSYFVALIHLGLKQQNSAFEALQAACAQRDPLLLWLNVDPRFHCFHSESKFLPLIRRTHGAGGM